MKSNLTHFDGHNFFHEYMFFVKGKIMWGEIVDVKRVDGSSLFHPAKCV